MRQDEGSCLHLLRVLLVHFLYKHNMRRERHPKFAEDRGEAGWGNQARTFPIRLLGSSLSVKQLETQPGPRLESSHWPSTEVELTLRLFVRY